MFGPFNVNASNLISNHSYGCLECDFKSNDSCPYYPRFWQYCTGNCISALAQSFTLGTVSQHWPSPLHWELYLIMAQPFKRELQLQLWSGRHWTLKAANSVSISLWRGLCDAPKCCNDSPTRIWMLSSGLWCEKHVRQACFLTGMNNVLWQMAKPEPNSCASTAIRCVCRSAEMEVYKRKVCNATLNAVIG